jgi:hypothetical protein
MLYHFQNNNLKKRVQQLGLWRPSSLETLWRLAYFGISSNAKIGHTGMTEWDFTE